METNDDDDRAVDLNGLDGEAGDQDVTNGSSAPYPATDDGHGFVEDSFEMPQCEYQFFNNVLGDGLHKDKEPGISTVAFDGVEELLWMGTRSGHVTSYHGVNMQKYTSFQVHQGEEVRQILPLDQNLLILTPTSLRSQIRRGIPLFTHSSENMLDLHSMLYNKRSGRLLLGGMQDRLVEFDLATSKETRQVDVAAGAKPGGVSDNGGTCAILRDSSRFVISGDVPRGSVHLRDPATLRVVHSLDAHAGILSDFDVNGNHLVTCGQAVSRHGVPQPDRFLMVYDLRIMRAITPIQIHLVPYQLRFFPAMSSRIAVLSSVGQVELVETAALSTSPVAMFQVDLTMGDIGSSSTISMDISPSNQCMAFGDTANYVHLYTQSNISGPAFNPFPRETEFADPMEGIPVAKRISMEDELAIYSSVARPFLPEHQQHNGHLSDFWPERFRRNVIRPTPPIQDEILRSMKVSGDSGSGFARNVQNLRRNQVAYPDVLAELSEAKLIRGNKEGSKEVRNGVRGGVRAVDPSLARAGAGHEGKEYQEAPDGSAARTASDESAATMASTAANFQAATVPKRYRKIGIKLSKLGSDDFDFDRYNLTSFCGLEASLPNSYSNSMLQVLYYTEKLRIMMLNHTCIRENCVCCELGFLFHMMDVGGGMPCQTSNFLRCLRTVSEASALGLIFHDQATVWKSNRACRLVQSWNRFILQQIHAQSSTMTNHRPTSKGSALLAAKGCHSSSSSSGNGTPASSPAKSATKGRPATTTPDAASLFSTMFGIKQEKCNLCSRCKHTKVHEDTLHLCNLVYPDLPATALKGDHQTPQAEALLGGAAKRTFGQVLCNSLNPEQSTPAWCDSCSKYQQTLQTRKVKELPFILAVNCGMDNPADVGFWQTQLEILHGETLLTSRPDDASAPKEDESNGGPTTVMPRPPYGAKACRYAESCSRADCKFWHPNLDLGVEGQLLVDIGAKCEAAGVSWIPMEIDLHCHENGQVSHGTDREVIDSPVIDSKSYELYGVCYIISDPATGQNINIVACINVGPSYHARFASPLSQWYSFNDFCITMIRPEEAVAVNLSWKVPAALWYQCKEAVTPMPPELKALVYSNPITADVFGSQDQALNSRGGAGGGRKKVVQTFMPLQPFEMPRKGDLVAIDAEFVTLNQEESELRSDGKVSTVKAAQMSVARITCVRGSGMHEGSPFIDDYISTQEQVVDYVTKFSGIKPGDLDANFSSKHLTTLKSTYLKLRYLIDVGCIFVGHGLKNDFKVINLVVPPEQVMDTVHLFHLPHHRMVSLKFLAWHFLGQRIQGTVHDSIEDAVTALALYKKYLQLKRNNSLIEALNGLYDRGKECNWKTPEDLA